MSALHFERPLPKLAKRRQQRIIAELFLNLDELFQRGFRGSGVHHDAVLIYQAILLGHAQDRPMTPTVIAKRTGLDRTTINRRLKQLVAADFIAHDGSRFWIVELKTARSGRKPRGRDGGAQQIHDYQAAAELILRAAGDLTEK